MNNPENTTQKTKTMSRTDTVCTGFFLNGNGNRRYLFILSKTAIRKVTDAAASDTNYTKIVLYHNVIPYFVR